MAKQGTIDNEVPVARQAAGTTARQTFEGHELAVSGETHATAVAAQAAATVQARYLVALKRPRDLDAVRVALLKECSRPGFAAIARYHKPIGKGVDGLSIRFAEAAIRCMTNVLTETATIYDDERKRIVRVTVTDLEANIPYSRDVTIDKVVERSVVKPGQVILSSRENSQGKTTFLVQATEDDLLNKEGALVSKALRTLALRILPGDLKEEGEAKVIETLESGAKADPDAHRKKIADAFAKLGVQPAALAAYLGHDLGTCSPAEIVRLQAIWAAIRDGETTWAATVEGRPSESAPGASPTPAAPKASAKTVDELKAEARAKAATPAPAAPSPGAAPPSPAKRPTTLRDRIAALEVKLGSMDLPSALFDALASDRDARDEGLTESFLAVTKARWPEPLLQDLAARHGFMSEEGPTIGQLVAFGEALPAPTEKPAQ